MDSRDPPPFGCKLCLGLKAALMQFPLIKWTLDTFTGDFFEPPPNNNFANGGPSLLNEDESQSLANFFSNTDPFLSDAPAFPASTDANEKTGLEEFAWEFPIPPAAVHGVSTIPNQAQLHHGFHTDLPFAQDPLPAPHLSHTQDDLQAASTLFNNAHATHTNSRSFSVPGLPSSSVDLNSPHRFHNMPLVSTPHGLIDEQLAALLPNHSENGSIDAAVAAQLSQLQHQPNPELDRHRLQLKRAYTYGTDSAFHPNGYNVSSSHNTEEAVTHRLMQGLRHQVVPLEKPAMPSPDSAKPPVSSSQLDFPIGLVELHSDEDERSEGGSSDEDITGERPAKKRRKGKNPAAVNVEKPLTLPQKNTSGRSGKGRKASLDENVGKKKRLSSAGQKRENLTEEQKRNNHILSEQKRRNLIKRGFDDLHDLVPEIRHGGLSKSSVLMEAANFLDKLLDDNNHFRSLLRMPDG
ncbi:hypothetical protein CC78DRAFT_286260 [Lojkania enalia]|uniref:BHLH domain-containing protein n=1 Tax=Lojkania enalia TaxID=147567 RepID=A0A9P4N5C4_9PLEO|nr:hypothetical protein CC78DRAFT_286260 [Didymosphaeria enalia]